MEAITSFASSIGGSIANDFTNMGKGIYTRATNQKAILLARKPLKDSELSGTGTTNANDKSMLSTIMALKTLAKGGTKAMAAKLNDTTTTSETMIAANTAAQTAQETALAAIKPKFGAMALHYNPSSIRLESVAGGEYTRLQGPGDAAMKLEQNYNVSNSMSMRVQLILDDMAVADAFCSPEYSANLESVAKLAGNIYDTAKNKAHSVQRQADGIMALLNREATKEVCFVWTNLFFHGNLQSVDINYTMFNPKGAPVRATVDICIKAIDREKKFAADDEYWNDAFTDCFGEGTGDTFTSASQTEGMAGALLGF